MTRRTRSGFTLIEAVLIVVVLGVTIPAGMRLVGAADRAQRESESSLIAVSVARSIAEQVLADVNASGRFGPDALADPATYLDDPAEGLHARTAWLLDSDPGTGMTAQVTIGEVGAGTEPGFRRVTIVVGYSAVWGADRDVRFEIDVRGE
ncbi:MAG: hypothetical protein ACF8Q5_03270 [Phycisphaerales bacterium JB040]